MDKLTPTEKWGKKIFIASPLRALTKEEFQANIKFAATQCRHAMLEGYMPFAPHVYLPQFMDEYTPEERELCLKAGKLLLDLCEEVWVFDYRGITPGMQTEIDYAQEKGIPIYYHHDKE